MTLTGALNETYVDMGAAGIVDPVKVTRFALQNAASIAGMVFSTERLIVEKPQRNASAGGSGHDDQMDY